MKKSQNIVLGAARITEWVFVCAQDITKYDPHFIPLLLFYKGLLIKLKSFHKILFNSKIFFLPEGLNIKHSFWGE